MLNLEEVNARIARACESLEMLESGIQGFCEDQRLELVHEKQQEAHVIDSSPPELLIEYSIMVGGIAYNPRSAVLF